MAVRILHAADFHLDSPFSALSDEKAALRRQESRELLMKVAALADSEHVQVVLLAGDLFDSGTAYWETQEMMSRMLSLIKVPVFIAPGNHDYFSPGSPYATMDLPDNVHIFRSPNIRCVELPELGCRVWGAGFTSSLCDSVLSGFNTGKSGFTDLMVLHGEIGGDRYNSMTEQDISGSGLDYLALGHVHSFSGIKCAGTVHYAYSGCLEGRGFDELGPKGVICGTVGKEQCDLHFVPLAARQYEIAGVQLTGSEDPLKTVETAVEGISPDNIVRAVLKGEYSGDIDKAGILSMLENRFFAADLKDETIPSRGIWDGADEDSLTGLFLSRMKEKYSSAQSDDERDKILLAVRYGIAALENREAWRP